MTKNKNTSSNKITVEERLRAKLKESYSDAPNSFLNEEDDEDLDFSDDEDLDSEGLEGEDEFSDDSEFDSEGLGDEDSFDDAGEELTDEQNEFFDDSMDSLLEPEVETPELDGDEMMNEAEDDEFGFEDDGLGIEGGGIDDIDVETEPDELGGFEDDLEDEFAEDGVIDDQELGEIIDAPNTYDVLGDTLEDISVDEFPSDDDAIANAELDQELEEAFDLYDQTGNHDQVGSMRPVVKEVSKKGTKPNQVKKDSKNAKPVVKNKPLKEDVKLTSELKSLDFDEEDSELEGTYDTVTKPEGKEGKVEHGKSLTKTMKSQTMQKESIAKSKMLVKAANHIDKLNKAVKQLRLENYRLIKANGILSAAADRLDKQSRSKISESFDKCKNVSQVDQLYKQIVNKIRQKSRPSLNESVVKSKTGVKSTNILNESNNQETLSYEQQRINMLMGIGTKDDVYMKFNK